MSKAWPRVKLGDILNRVERFERRDELIEYPFAGTYSYARGIFVGERKQGSTFALPKIQRIRAGDFIYCKIMAWEGAFGLVPKEADGCVMSGAFVAYEVNDRRVDLAFLDWYFKVPTHWQEVGSQSSGTNVRRQSLHPRQFEKTEMPLPSLTEQRRIVARIKELATKIDEARLLRAQIIAAVEVLSYAGLRLIRHELQQSTYPKAALGSITKVTAGGTPSRENSAYWNGTVPWVKTGELLDGDISSSAEFITNEGVENSSAKIFPAETVLIALYGQGQTRGRTGRLLIPAATNQACCAILPNPEKFEARYIQYWLRSLYIELREESQGGAQPNWNGGMIKELEIVLPALSEQLSIVAELDALQLQISAQKQLQAESAAELDALLPAILDRAFKGEL
jgi:type I restriction enzyme S subunit